MNKKLFFGIIIILTMVLGIGIANAKSQEGISPGVAKVEAEISDSQSEMNSSVNNLDVTCDTGWELNTIYNVTFADFVNGTPAAAGWDLGEWRIETFEGALIAESADVADIRLTSRSIDLPSNGRDLRLYFGNSRDIELNYDGGILEISTDDGNTWEQISTDKLLNDPYDGPVSDFYSDLNPLRGYSAWAERQLYINTEVNVDAYAGETVRFRFRLGTDEVNVSSWNFYNMSVQSCQETGGLSLVPDTYVGVIPGSDGCPTNYEQIVIAMTDENDGNADNSEGWTGAIRQWRIPFPFSSGIYRTALVFCKVPGAEFSTYGYDVADDSYAVLRLGQHCPDYSIPFSRRFDNEDDRNGNYEKGNVYPNITGENTRLYFCYFPGGDYGAPHMSSFPDLGFEYGVFGPQYISHPFDEFGSVHTDDEDENTNNSLDVSSEHAGWVADISDIISSGSNTTMHIAKVSEAQVEVDVKTIPLTIALHRSPCPSLDGSTAICNEYRDIIERFADLVYQMSNGGHRLGKITVYQSSDAEKHADILWTESRNVIEATTPGINSNGTIFFADKWIRPTRVIPFLGDPTDHQHGAVTLAHEFGHYNYGVLDEYNLRESVMSVLVTGGENGAEFSTDFMYESANYTTTAHYSEYGRSLWEMLTQPSENPRSVELTARALPIVYDELVDLAPTGNVNIDNLGTPEERAIARGALDIEFLPSGSINPLTLVHIQDEQTHTTTSSNVTFVVDGGVSDRIRVSISWDGRGGNSPGRLILRDPSGQIQADVNCTPYGGQKESTCTAIVGRPDQGEWTMEIEIPAPPLDIYHDIEISTSQPGAQYHASMWSAQGTLVSYPTPVIIVTQIAKDRAIARAGIQAYYDAPDGQRHTLILKDDGISPDALADDGEYTGYLDYDQDGEYRIYATVDNDAGNAVFTSRGMPHSDDEPLTSVGENFHRQTDLIVQIINVAADDHDDSASSATPLDPENLDIAGRIDFAGDVDTFKVTPTATGQLMARVTGLGMDMEPVMRILTGANCTTLVEEVVYQPGSGAYPFAFVDVVANVPFCIEVSHRNPSAVTGFYFVSAGSSLYSDVVVRHDVYLPTILLNSSSPPPVENTVTGTVTDNEVPVSGTELLLRYYDGSTWSTYATTTTDSGGNYQFTSLPTLGTDQGFYVRWENTNDDSNRLSTWACWSITSSTTDPNAYQCDFDLEDIVLVSPNPGASVSLPYTFYWNIRGITTDDYELNIADASDNDPYWYNSVGYVNSYTLSGLPTGFSLDQEYGWWMWVYGPDGYGISYYYQNITFSSTSNVINTQDIPVSTRIAKENIEIISPPRSK